MENVDNYCLESEEEGEINIEVEWRVTYHQERHEVGDGVAWERWHEYEVASVRREDNDEYYEPDFEEAHEDWHYLFDDAYVKGEIQPS